MGHRPLILRLGLHLGHAAYHVVAYVTVDQPIPDGHRERKFHHLFARPDQSLPVCLQQHLCHRNSICVIATAHASLQQHRCHRNSTCIIITTFVSLSQHFCHCSGIQVLTFSPTLIRLQSDNKSGSPASFLMHVKALVGFSCPSCVQTQMHAHKLT